MSLPDYRFVDEKKIDALLAGLQVSDESIEKDKKIGAEFSITGPKVSFEQVESRKPLNIYEKIDTLEQALSDRSELAFSRPSIAGAVGRFVREDCPAVRVSVPATSPSEVDLPAFTFWVCPGNDRDGLLCLLEDTRADDGDSVNYTRNSTYTVMQSLAYYARQDIDRSIIAPQLPRVLPPQGKAPDKDHPASLFYEFHSVEPYLNEFAKNPVELMKRWKAIVTPPRNVRTLYRVREYGPEAAHSFQKVTTFGYPLYISIVGP